MNYLIAILLIVPTLIVLLLVVGLFAKNDYSIKREIAINRSLDEVYVYIKLLRNQEKYNKWTMADPGAHREYKGTDGELGGTMSWNSTNKQVGQGEQEIVALHENERVEYNLRFIRPFVGVANSTLELRMSPAQQTQVSWTFESAMKYPMNIMLLFMDMDKMLGRDLEVSLENLKNNLEKATL